MKKFVGFVTTTSILYGGSSLLFAKQEPENLVILGSGWGAVALTQGIDTKKFNVTIVSPRNYFLFTPLLPATTTGTIDSRTITEPIRNLIMGRDPRITYYEASCTEIDVKSKVIKCEDISPFKSASPVFTIPYNKLVLAVGATSNTFGTKGVVENCFFLKNLEDGAAIRNRIIDCMESCALPNVSEEEKTRMLSFCVCGGGPTGVEFCGELRDMKNDLEKSFPDLKPYFKITLIQSADHILNTYSAEISKYAESRFKSHGINVLTNARVLEVTPDKIVYLDKKDNKKIDLPYGLCVWSTGIKPIPLISSLISTIPGQKNHVAITTDPTLKVKGVEDVYAIGDCSTVESGQLINKMIDLFKEADDNHDGKMSLDEFREFMKKHYPEFPQLRIYSKRIDEVFQEYDVNHDGILDEAEFATLLKNADKMITSFPPTAQVASQQGSYLASLLNGSTVKPFDYKHRGSFAYVGGSDSVLDSGKGSIFSGFAAWVAWRSVYFSKQLSWKGMFCLGWDWTKSAVFGRDVSRQ